MDGQTFPISSTVGRCIKNGRLTSIRKELQVNLQSLQFGNSPAAIYLVDRLKQINNRKFYRKIATTILEHQTLIAEVNASTMSKELTLLALDAIEERVRKTADSLKSNNAIYESTVIPLPDTLAINLMVNVVMAGITTSRRII